MELEKQVFEETVGQAGAESPTGPRQAAAELEGSLDEDEEEEEEDEVQRESGRPVDGGSGKSSILMDIASKAFRRRGGGIQGSRSMPNVATMDEVATFSHTTEDILKGMIPIGSPCGYLFRYYTSLTKLERLYYIIDVGGGKLYEFESKETVNNSCRNVLEISQARLEEELVLLEVPRRLYCWKIFLRMPDKMSAKMICFGATSIDKATAWIRAFQSATSPSGKNSSTTTDGLTLEEGGLKSPKRNLTPPPITLVEDKEWVQPLIVHGRVYNIKITDICSNAWLLSEGIRLYMHELNRDPKVTTLFNVTQNKALDLSEDVYNSINPGDTLQALTGSSPAVDEPLNNAFFIPKGLDFRKNDLLQVWERCAAKFLVHGVEIPIHLLYELEMTTANASTPFLPSNRWDASQIVGGIRVYTMTKQLPKANVNQALCITTIDATPNQVLQGLLEVHRESWDPFLRYGRFLEATANADLVNLWTAPFATFPLLPREFTVARFWACLPDGTYVIIYGEASHPCKSYHPLHSTGTLEGAYAIRPYGNSSWISHLSKVDLKSPIKFPNMNLPALTAGALGGLKQRLACDKQSS